ncbi:phage tail protein [Pseudomonas sp. MIACH]|jgi:microcystin-dependent protein|uniref:phage tail protein n=1 Tax=Pseudomonas sp. MIACH TaxID=1078355 RepID=UPI00069D9C59|nr:tail fiber protein [Pseudomonas sp. MIACH]
MEVFLGTVQMFAFNYAPQGWAYCNGQLVSIAQNNALFALLGTVYGGDGQNTFALPNLQGRAPIHMGNGAGLTPRVIGEVGGTEKSNILSGNLPTQLIPTTGLTVTTTINLANEPSAATTTPTSTNAYIGASSTGGPGSAAIYSDNPGSAPVALKGASSTLGGNLTVPGGNQPLPTMAPYLALNFSIALTGLFPPRP